MRAVRTNATKGDAVVLYADGFTTIPIRDSGAAVFSYWRPSLRERLALIFGGNVRLGALDHHHPAVTLDTLS